MIYITIIIIGCCIFTALIDWRKGLFATIVVALLQDPLRKLIPDQPVYIIVLAAVVLAAVVVGALHKRVPLDFRRIAWWRHGLSAPFLCLLLWISVQAVHSLLLFGNVMLTAVGLLSYLGAVPAVLIGHRFAIYQGLRGIERWLTFYALAAGLALSTVLMEYQGLDLPIFGQVGGGMAIFDLGTVLIGNAGTFRTTEVAAWHAATAACVLLLVLTAGRLNYRRIALAIFLVSLFVGIGILTGRRKLLMEVSLFVIAYVALLAVFSRGALRLAVVVFAAGGLSLIYIPDLQEPRYSSLAGPPSEYELFLQRGATVIDDAPERVRSVGLASATWAIRRYGFLGSGVGIGTAGAQHFGGGAQVFGGAGEAGLGKIMSELGVPGVAIIIWGLIALARHIHRILTFVARRSIETTRLSCGLVALLMANGAVYFVATQVFSDLFILIFLGLNLGFLLAMPDLAARVWARNHSMHVGPQRQGASQGNRPVRAPAPKANL